MNFILMELVVAKVVKMGTTYYVKLPRDWYVKAGRPDRVYIVVKEHIIILNPKKYQEIEEAIGNII